MKYYLPAIVPLAALLVIVACLLGGASKTEDGLPVFPLDDTYIHMTMAQNFADAGSWSITGEGIQGASSSPLWTLLLAGMYSIGAPREWSPLLLNVLAGCATIFIVFYAAARRQWPNYLAMLVSLCIVLWSPLFTNVVVGMEQTLHLMLMMLLFTFAGEYLVDYKDAGQWSWPWKLMLLAALATSVRYESGMLVLAVCVALALQKRLIPGFVLGLSVLAPIGAYALFAARQGAMAAPTSVLVKGVGTSSTWARIAKLTTVFAFYRLAQCPYMAALIFSAIVSYIVYLRRRKETAEAAGNRWPGRDAGYLFGTWLAATWMFLDATSSDAFFRYDAYLIAMGVFTIGALWAPWLPQQISLSSFRIKRLSWSGIAVAAILIATGVIFSWRSAVGGIKTPLASQNIQQQQYQMARFLRDYYPGKAVAINDIGAISYFAKSKIVDIWGLASTKVAKEILLQSYNPESIERICNEENVQIAVVYTSWFTRYGGLPKSWVPVASWTIPDNYICGDSTVTFYAVQPDQVSSLRQHLVDFSSRLPSDVKVEYEPEKAAAAHHEESAPDRRTQAQGVRS